MRSLRAAVAVSARSPRPPLLLIEPDVADDHRLVDRLDHVVDRQRRDGDGGERFHLDAGLRRGADARLDVVAACGGGQLDVNARKRERMTERDERGGLLGGHDPGEPRGLQRIAFLHRAGADQPQRLARHRDRSARDRFAVGDRLVADVDHLHAAAAIDVRQRSAGSVLYAASLPPARTCPPVRQPYVSLAIALPGPDRTTGSPARR